MISAGKAAMERGITFSIAVVYIVQQLTQLEMLTPILGCLVFLAIAILLPNLKGVTFWLSVSFMVAGTVLMLFQEVGASVWFESAGINVTIVTLFLFAPLFGIPVRIPQYVEALKRFYEENFRSKAALFIGTQILTQIMGVFINVGSIPVVYQMVLVKPQPGMSRLLANALNRGFAGAILWSPYFAAMTLVTTALELPWSSVLPYMLGLAFLSLVVSFAVDFREIQGAETDGTKRESIKKQGSAVFPIGLGIYLLSAILAILILERLIELPMVILICMAAVLFPLIWCMANGAMAIYRQGLKNHVTVTLPALQKEITLFLAAGFFSGSIGATKFGSSIPAMLEQIPLSVSITFSLFTVLLIAGSSLIGLHPIVPVTILAGGIDPASVGISPLYFAVLLLGSWSLSNPISPASAVNNLLAGLFKKPVFEVVVPNYKFAGCMAIVLIIYVMVVLGN
ncbi:hypothetical protein [Paenibacillus oryzisoli]|uniref:Citrate transporter-like domain-containing protein n=1 Tax=Paenibacillus oryzisoli TaxID=1850517 RepID=A0A198AJY9_9BACL|nr:hypothetical protein [Paenibacillus oryzisoli]OAS21243.1 hypothetical protein A8708_30670 [Paenibacillus oryzisoli]